MKRIAAVLIIGVLTTGLPGCATKRPASAPAAATEQVVPPASTGAADAGGAGQAQALPDHAGASGDAALVQKTSIYFDFDSAEIRSEFAPVIAAHARKLGGSPGLRVRLEGNTDERGSPEYNIGLGERRAQSVKKALVLQGATDAQMTTVSFGEERPAVEGHSEEAWAKNRRVDILYSGAP